MSSSLHIDNEGKYILIIGEGLTKGLGDTTLIAEARYPINFTQWSRRFVLSQHYNERYNFLFVDAIKIRQKIQKLNHIHYVR